MKQDTPQSLMQEFRALTNRGDLNGLIALYEQDAVFIPEPGVTVRGLSEIRQALADFLALKPVLQVHTGEVHRSGDIALVINEWTMEGTAPDGTPVVEKGRSSDVLRLQTNGDWRVLIDRP